jgi:hypothetical protein
MVNKKKQEKEHTDDYTEETVHQTTRVQQNQLHCAICKTVDQKEVLVFDWRMVIEPTASIYIPLNLLSGSKTGSDLHIHQHCSIDNI